jgi:hypothetical protein
MPIVSGNQSAEIKIQISAEMDKASAKAVQDAVAKMSADERKATEEQIRGERLLAQAEAERAAKQQAASKAQIDAQNQYRASLMKTKETAMQLAGVANSISMAGVAMLAPFIAATVKFAASASKGDAVAIQYRASMASMENSTIRLGRATADVLNPILANTASILSDIVGFMEQNPDAIKTFLAVGGTLAVGGKIAAGGLTLASQVATIKLAQSAAMGGVTAIAGQATGGALAGGGIAAAATAAAPVIIPILIAAGIVALAVAAAVALKNSGVIDEAQAKIAATGTAYPGIIPGTSGGPRATGTLHTTTTPVSHVGAGAGGMASLQAMERGVDLEKLSLFNTSQIANRKLDEEMKANEKRLAATKDFEAKRADTEKAQAEMTRSYLQADAQAHQDYYNQRSDIARQAGIEASRAEEDHQKNIAKIQRDSDARIFGMVQERDALGIVQEKRNAEVQRSDAEEQYRTEVSRRNQDMAERLRIMDREFSATNQRRLAEYQYNISIKNAEVAIAQQAYNAIVSAGANMINSINAMMSGAGASEKFDRPGLRKPGDRYATGGNVRRTGLATVDAGELIINRSNRQMAENLIGGNLTQSSLLDALRGGGSRATINNNFGGTVSIQQVAAMIDMSANSIMQSINRSVDRSIQAA